MPEERSTAVVELAHVGAMDLAYDGVEVDAVGHGRAEDHVSDVCECVCDCYEVVVGDGFTEFLNLLSQQSQPQRGGAGTDVERWFRLAR